MQKPGMQLLLVLCSVVLGCGGGGGGHPTCNAAGGICFSANDCCQGLSCVAGKCAVAQAQCITSGNACAMTTDCCQGLICTANKCSPPPMCGGSGGSCAQTPDCCNGLVCNGGKCGQAQCRMGGDACASTLDCCMGLVCSSGKCGANACRGVGDACEITADCCNPLVCAAGHCGKLAMCRTAGQACANTNDCCQGLVCVTGQCANGQTAVLTWQVSDNCFNGEAIQFRFYDETDQLVWPDNQTVYLATGGQMYQSMLSCKLGNTICIGANQPQHNNIWGVNIDNSLMCNDCCYKCDNATGTSAFACP